MTHRCHNREFLLKFALDRDSYRAKLRDHLREFEVALLDYCITSNHVHLLLNRIARVGWRRRQRQKQGCGAVPKKVINCSIRLVTQNVDLLLDRVRVTIKDGPIITQQPVGGTFESGMPAMLSVAVSGTAPLSYQWRRNGNDISGANGSVYVIPSVQAVHDGTYDVVVSNGAGSTTSSSAVVTVHQVFTNGSFESGYDGWTSSGNQNIGTHHTDGVNGVQFNGGNQTPNGVLSQTFTTTIGQAYVLAFDLGVLAWNQDEQRLAVTVTGGSTLVSQIANIFGTGGGNVNWAPKSYSFVADSALTTLTFQDASPTTDSLDVLLDNVRVSSDEPPVITMHPASVSVGAGSPATFSVMASGPPPLAYQWRFNASPIPNATSSSYTLWNAQISDAGNYDVVVANGAGAVTSAAAVLTVTQTGAFNNGSFESSYTAWTASGNQGIASGAPYQATDGIKLVAFNWGNTPPNGVLYQTFATPT